MVTTQERTLWRARDAFLEHDVVPDPQTVRPVILDSWRRSRDFGLTPADAHPLRVSGVDPDVPLARAARSVIGPRMATMSDLTCGAVVCDQDGTVLATYGANNSFESLMQETDCLPGFRLAERDLGTLSAGVSLTLDASVLVVGAEHFSALVRGRSSAGTPIHHPMTGEVIGSVNFACEVEYTSPAMIQWTEELARLIQAQVTKSLSSAEQSLLRAYLSSPHGRRDPVLYVNEHTFIASAAASRLAPPLDRAFISRLAQEMQDGPPTGHVEIPLRDHSSSVDATWEAVDGGTGVVGLAVRLSPAPRPTARVASRPAAPQDDRAVRDPLADLVGVSPAWRRVRSTLHTRDRGTPLLVAGESGTGKTAIVERLRDRVLPAFDAREHVGRTSTWLASLADALTAGRPSVMVENLQTLPADAVMSVCDLVRGTPGTTEVLATWRLTADHELTASAGTYGPAGWPGSVVCLPPVRERLGDVPDVLRALTRRRTATRQQPVWAAESLEVLDRVQWRENVHSLDRLVAEVLRRQTGPVIRPEHLPTTLLRSATRRQLTGLERLETDALTAALISTDGNKRLAAEVLGISRSTLYRKLKALGLESMSGN